MLLKWLRQIERRSLTKLYSVGAILITVYLVYAVRLGMKPFINKIFFNCFFYGYNDTKGRKKLETGSEKVLV